jgi:hypothetical protein
VVKVSRNVPEHSFPYGCQKGREGKGGNVVNIEFRLLPSTSFTSGYSNNETREVKTQYNIKRTRLKGNGFVDQG